MAYDGRLLRLAQERYEADRSAREADLAEQREQLYARRPRLREIQDQLRRTASRVMAAALRRGEDPLPEIQRLRETAIGTDSFLDKAKRYTDITELTPELLRLFIEKIVVHEKEVKWSKHAPQTVEIYYNGIGYVGSGQQDVEEALEAPESLQTQDTEKPRQAS